MTQITRNVLVTAIVLVLAGVALAQGPSLNAHEDQGLAHEGDAVSRLGLTRFADQAQLERAIRQGIVVRVPDHGKGFRLDPRVGGHASKNRDYYKYARPWTRNFIVNMGNQYSQRTGGKAFTVTSLVRTTRYQQLLSRQNGNAAPPEKTSHTTGATIDITLHSVSPGQIAWFQALLLRLEGMGKILATRERAQPVFHIMVLPAYDQRPAMAQRPATRRGR